MRAIHKSLLGGSVAYGLETLDCAFARSFGRWLGSLQRRSNCFATGSGLLKQEHLNLT